MLLQGHITSAPVGQGWDSNGAFTPHVNEATNVKSIQRHFCKANFGLSISGVSCLILLN